MPRTPPSYLCMSWFVEMFVLFKDTVDGRRSSYPPGPVGLCESKGRIKIELFSRFKKIHVCIPVKFKPFRSLSLKFLNRIKKTRIWDICLGSFCCSCFWPLRRQCLKSIFARELYSLIMNYIFGDSLPTIYVMAWPMRIKPPIVKARRDELWGDGD